MGPSRPGVAERCVSLLWEATGRRPDAPDTWDSPVVRLGYRSDPPFVEAITAPALREGFDLLAGPDRWWPRPNVGTFVVRFPHHDDPGDAGWHVDASFRPEGVGESDVLRWRINSRSDGRVLLFLMLFSEVGSDDAPTRVRVGSHRALVPALDRFGDAGADNHDLVPLPEGDVALATGDPGDVYLCHPFLIHAAQPHRGGAPRFLAQPPLHQRSRLDPFRIDGHRSAVETAIWRGHDPLPRAWS